MTQLIAEKHLKPKHSTKLRVWRKSLPGKHLRTEHSEPLWVWENTNGTINRDFLKQVITKMIIKQSGGAHQLIAAAIANQYKEIN
jgi:hypothetical protein